MLGAGIDLVSGRVAPSVFDGGTVDSEGATSRVKRSHNVTLWAAVAGVVALVIVAAIVIIKPGASNSPLTVDPAGPSYVSRDPVTGVVTGSLGVTHTDGERLRYAITSNTTTPNGGRLSIDEAAGTFTYTPTQAARLRTDRGLAPGETFVVSVTDGKHDPVSVTVTPPLAPAHLDLGEKPIAVGMHPIDVAVSPDGARVYILNMGGGGTLSVIDTANNAVVGPPIALGLRAPSRFAINPQGTRLYITDVETNTLSVIDTANGTPIGDRIPVGKKPLGVAVSHDGTRVYVSNVDDGTVSVIDTTGNTVIGDPIRVGVAPFGVAVSPDGTRLYVIERGLRVNGAYGQGTVSVIDTATRAVIGPPLRVGAAPEDLAVSPDGAHVYVVNADEGTMSVIDTATNTVVGKPNPVGSFPANVAVSPDGSLAYFTNSGDGTLAVVDTATNEVVASLKVVVTPAPGQGFLYAVALTPNGNRAYVTNYDTGSVPVISFA